MKKRFCQRIISAILAATMLFSLSTTVFANEVQPRYIPDGQIILSIHAGTASESSSSDSNFGHAYISVENYTGRQIVVGNMKLAHSYGVSLGVYNAGVEPSGLYYDREFVRNDREYWSYSTVITSSQLTKLNSYIKANDRWSVAYNCSVFAATAWNQVATPQFASSYFSTPTDLASYIERLDGSEYNATLPLNGGVIYYVNNGTLVRSQHN